MPVYHPINTSKTISRHANRWFAHVSRADLPHGYLYSIFENQQFWPVGAPRRRLLL
jgi:hypothetical protein